MKHKAVITSLVIGIAALSIFASLWGVFSTAGEGEYIIESFRGEAVRIYGKGLYEENSVSIAAQGIAQDIITLVLGIPILLTALYFARKGSLKGKLLLTGTIGYFLYTYLSYVFLWMYNPLFILYVVTMSTSFFAFVLIMTSYNLNSLKLAFNSTLPVKFLGGFQLFFATALGVLWLGKLVPTITKGEIPVGLEHYTTLVIQGLDLGFVVPVAFLSGILLIKKKPLGYLLSSVVIVKGFTMGAAISAMIISQYFSGIAISPIELIVFPLFSLSICYCLYVLLRNIREPS